MTQVPDLKREAKVLAMRVAVPKAEQKREMPPSDRLTESSAECRGCHSILKCVNESVITAAITQVAANKLKIKIDAKCDLGSCTPGMGVLLWGAL